MIEKFEQNTESLSAIDSIESNVEDKVSDFWDKLEQTEHVKSVDESNSSDINFNQRPTPRESELKAKEIYGGEEQKTFKDGKEVPYGTPGGTRPDLYANNTAYEVKNYILPKNEGLMTKELTRQISDRVENLPENTKQVIVIDIRGQNIPDDYKNSLSNNLTNKLNDICPDIKIDYIEETKNDLIK